MSELSLMITIADQQSQKRLLRLFEQQGASVSFGTYGRGTATSRVLDSFGLERSEKIVLHTVVSDDAFPVLRRSLERQLLLDAPGTGIAFLVPLSSVGGKKQLGFLLGSQPFEKGEESVLKNTEYELIVAIANQGYTQTIMDAARSVGAGGGTVVHAKGTGMQNAEKFLGFIIAEEKEMVYIVVPAKRKDAVMRAIMDAAGLKSRAQAICFSLPVTAAAGMQLLLPEEEL